jgi:DNA-binding NtrC family response regulator
MTVETERPDAILLDINLPDSTGISTLDCLRQVWPDVPIIMVTGNTDAELARDTLKRGAFDYVMKLDLDRLARVVEVALASLGSHSLDLYTPAFGMPEGYSIT